MRGVAAIAGVLGAALALASCANAGDEPPVSCGPETDQAPDHLACTGLYADFASKTVAPTARLYAPGAALWSDGYDKTRYLALPDGAQIDATDVDQWVFPVGTKVWKEFRSDGRKIETRLLWKVRPDRWVHASYVWSEDGKTATRGEGRALTVDGLPYAVPRVEECAECHRGKKDTLLGVEALSLAQPAASGATLAALVAEGRLSPPPARPSVTIDPGLAVLHVNCGVSCHNASPIAAGKDNSIRLDIGFDEAATRPVAAWRLFQSTVGVPSTLPGLSGALRIAPGAPDRSAVVTSMTTRGTGQMPPSTRDVDFDGITAVKAWVRALPP